MRNTKRFVLSEKQNLRFTKKESLFNVNKTNSRIYCRKTRRTRNYL